MGALPGIEIRYSSSTNPLNKLGKVRLEFLISKMELPARTPRIFVTNKFIREAISKLSSFPLHETFGHMQLDVDLASNTAHWKGIEIFGSLPDFEKKGIASILEMRALQYLKKEFPGVRYISHNINMQLRKGRVRQLRRRGLWSDTEGESFKGKFSIEDEMSRLRERIAVNAWKHTPPKPLSKRAALPLAQWSHQNLVRRRKRP